MKRGFTAFGLAVLGSVFIQKYENPAWAFTARQTVTVTASASVTGGTAGSLIINAPPLPSEAFFGKNVVIPVTVTNPAGPIDPQNLKVEMFYLPLSSLGSPLSSAYVNVPVPMQQASADPKTLTGAAIIARSDIQSLSHGGQLQYFFQATQTTGATILGIHGISHVPAGSGPPSDPFAVAIINTLSWPVGPQGAIVAVPDTFIGDGQTSVTFAPGALSSLGTLVIQLEDPEALPTGPGGAAPQVAYTFTLEGASLRTDARLVLSYPADVDGSVIGSHANPQDLAPYFQDSATNFSWQILSLPQIDITSHTVTAMTTHFSTFALFASGSVGTADLRPAERIITPNNDNINDKAHFGFNVDEVHIFDARGRRVKSISGPSPVWDGTDDEGRIVDSGVYIYQYTANGQRVSGVIGVAK